MAPFFDTHDDDPDAADRDRADRVTDHSDMEDRYHKEELVNLPVNPSGDEETSIPDEDDRDDDEEDDDDEFDDDDTDIDDEDDEDEEIE